MITQSAIDWVSFKLEACVSDVSKVALYGSMARGAVNPSDCDLLIVTAVKVDSVEWKSLKQIINKMKMEFVEKFELPLNVAFLTNGEWGENHSFFKDLIDIKIIPSK